MALLYGPFALYRENAIFTSRPGITNEYYVTKFGRRHDVGKIYKLTEFGEDRLRNGASTWWRNKTVL